jgi:hypothetical protein
MTELMSKFMHKEIAHDTGTYTMDYNLYTSKEHTNYICLNTKQHPV